MRRLGVVLTLLLAAATPAAGAIHIHVLAATGDKAPNGTYTAMIESSYTFNVAHGGVVYFEAAVDNENRPWIYRWEDGKVTLISQEVAQSFTGDDLGTIAWYDFGNDGCQFSVLAPGATVPARTGCTRNTAGGFSVLGGKVYFTGDVNDPNNVGEQGLFVNNTLIRTLPSGFGGVLNDGTNLYLYGPGNSLWELAGFSSFTQVVPPGANTGFLAVAPGHVLYGTNKQAYDVTPAGTVDLTQQYGRLWIGNSGDVVLHQTDTGSFDKYLRLEPDGAHTVFGRFSKTTDGWSIQGLYPNFATPHDDDGTLAAVVTLFKGSAAKTAIVAAIDECFRPKPVGDIPLDAQDERDARHEAAHSLDGFEAQVKKAIAALKADTKKHPSHKRANDDAIDQLELQLATGDFRALTAHTRASDDKQDLVDNAKCSWLESASTTLNKAATGKYEKEIKELGTRLLDLKKVLNGEVKRGSKPARDLLETNLVALGERFGGDNGGKLTRKAAKLYNVLAGQIAEKDLPKEVKSEIVDLAKVLGGKNAGELAAQITTLVDVLHGDVDADKQYEVLKDSVSALATRIGVEGLLKAPQARAAMLGFEIGKAFADRMSVDLQLVADRELKLACLNALADAQHAGHSWAELDFTQKTVATVPSLASHPGWVCTIHPEADVEGYPNHTLVEAYKPVKVYLGFIKTGGDDIWFDPSF